MTFTDDLRRETATTWDAAVDHRFVDELWHGDVDPAAFTSYLVQGHQLLDAFVALLGAAVAAADRPPARTVLARRLGAMAGSEVDFSAAALDALDVPLADRTHPELHPPTSGLLELLHAARRAADYTACVTVLLAAEWLHLDLTTRPGVDPTDEPLQRTWIDLHRGPAVEAWVSFLRLELDRTAATLDEPAHARVRELFAQVVDLELALLDAVRS